MRAKKITQAKKNFIYNSMYQILLIIIPLITTPYIARILGAEKIGEYSYSHAVAYYFVMFIMLGLNNYGNRTIAFNRENKENLSKKFTEIYAMQLLIATVVITFYILYTLVFSNNTLTWLQLVYVVSAAIDINWLFFGLEQFKKTATRSSIVKILTTVSIFVFVKKPDDLNLYAAINVIGILISQLILWFYVKKYISRQKIDLKSSLKHLKPNLVLFIPVVAISLYKMMDKIMLGSMSNMEQVGFYENTEKVVQVPLAIITALGTVMMPRIANLIAKKNFEKIRAYLNKSILFAVFLSSAMCFGIMAVAKDFVPWYYGNNYDPCILLFQILMPSCLFLAVANVIRTQYLIPFKQEKTYIASVIAGAVVNLIINSLLIPKNGAMGAAIGTLVAEASVCIIQIILSRKKISAIKTILKSSIYILIGGILYVVVMMVPDISTEPLLNLAGKMLIGAVVYTFLALPLFLYMNKKDSKQIAAQNNN